MSTLGDHKKHLIDKINSFKSSLEVTHRESHNYGMKDKALSGIRRHEVVRNAL